MNELSTFINEQPLASFLVFLVAMQLAISLGKIGATHKGCHRPVRRGGIGAAAVAGAFRNRWEKVT